LSNATTKYYPDETELLECCRNGEQSAFTEIVRRYKSRVASTISGMLGKGDYIDDIGQEVFIRFFNGVNTFRGESSVGTYITRIAINLSLNEIKRRNIRRFLSFDGMLEEGHDIKDESSLHIINEKCEIVQKSIQKLNAKYRTVLVLRLIDDYSTEETAKILDIPVGTVLSRLSRAQKMLKEILEPYKLNYD